MDESVSRLRQLQSISEAALAHLRFDDLVNVLLERLTELLGSDTAAVLLVDEDGKDLVARAAKGLEEEVEARVRVPVGKGFAGRIAAQRGPVAVPNLDEFDVVNPILREKGLRSMLGVPLLVEGRVIGVVHVGTLSPRDFTADDGDLLQAAADRMALAIDHARLYEAERAARAEAERSAEHIRRIETISAAALHHIAPDLAVFERLLSRVREALDADSAGLLVAEEETQVLVMRAADGLHEEVERDVSVPVGRGFAGVIAEHREPVIVDDASEIEIVSPMLRRSGVRSLAGVPLVIEQRLLGVLLVGSLRPAAFKPDDVSLLRLAGDRLAVALDHSRLYQREHFVASTLQRSLLPERLPELPGAQLASRYLPGEDEAVGGDWYDVIPLPNGEVAIAMGDVVSRGIRAASAMGQLRNAMRAYAIEDPDPVKVLTRLDRLVRSMEGREMATLAYAVLDLETRRMEHASAGHPPSLVISADGEAQLLDEGRGPPLGALPDSVFESQRVDVDPGDSLLLYTDGLVERRDMWIDEGIERLVGEVRGAAAQTPEALLEHLMTTMLGGGSVEDDVALLALRLEPLPEHMLRLRLPADPDVLASMRQSLRLWLAETPADDDATYDILVSVTEASANSIEHAYGPGDASFEVIARCEEGNIEVAVRDSGSWRPPRGQNRGRGTLLMQELMDEFEVETGEGGTEVRMKKRLTAVAVG